MTYVATLSHLRRVNTPIEKTGKLVQPRKLHPTQWGVVCPAETPEGASVGLVKNLALLTTITVATPSDPVRAALLELGLDAFDAATKPSEAASVFGGASPTYVMVNGDIVGAHGDPVALVCGLRRLKRSGVLSVFTSIAWHPLHREVAICTEGGRFVRPLLVIDAASGRPAIDEMTDLSAAATQGRAKWHDLVLSGAIEYLDVDETNCALMAMTREHMADKPLLKFTHLEVSPSVMLGVVAGSIPFSDHNQVKPFLF